MLNRRLALALLSLSLSLLAVPAAAVAQDSLPAPDAAVKTTIKLSGTNLVNRAVLSGSPWTVKGTVSSYVPGQSVELTVLLGSRTIVSRTLPLLPSLVLLPLWKLVKRRPLSTSSLLMVVPRKLL